MTRLEHLWLGKLDLAHAFTMTDQAVMDGLNDVVAGNVQPASTTSTTNNTPAGTSPAVSTATTPTDVMGVQTAGTNSAVDMTTNLQDMTMMIASLQTTIANLQQQVQAQTMSTTTAQAPPAMGSSASSPPPIYEEDIGRTHKV